MAIQQSIASVSPDGRYRLSLTTTEASNAQQMCSFAIINTMSDAVFQILESQQSDLPERNHYWDSHSKFLIVEDCDALFTKGKIRIIELETMKTQILLNGVIGNCDKKGNQFDTTNNILFYFNISGNRSLNIPDLYAYNLLTNTNTKLMGFEQAIDVDFPKIKTDVIKRTVTVEYNDIIRGQRLSAIVQY